MSRLPHDPKRSWQQAEESLNLCACTEPHSLLPLQDGGEPGLACGCGRRRLRLAPLLQDEEGRCCGMEKTGCGGTFRRLRRRRRRRQAQRPVQREENTGTHPPTHPRQERERGKETAWGEEVQWTEKPFHISMLHSRR